jgi:hypothetical protein
MVLMLEKVFVRNCSFINLRLYPYNLRVQTWQLDNLFLPPVANGLYGEDE